MSQRHVVCRMSQRFFHSINRALLSIPSAQVCACMRACMRVHVCVCIRVCYRPYRSPSTVQTSTSLPDRSQMIYWCPPDFHLSPNQVFHVVCRRVETPGLRQGTHHRYLCTYYAGSAIATRPCQAAGETHAIDKASAATSISYETITLWSNETIRQTQSPCPPPPKKIFSGRLSAQESEAHRSS